MKIISKIKIHPLSYIIALIFFLMGKFRQYIIFMIIILVHELGHIMAGLLFKWNIDQVLVLPFGCLTKFKECINRPIKEEFIISIMGVIFQLMFVYRLNIFYNNIIIVFNLLPIYPLDGYKILNLIFNKISNFKLSYLISIYISYIITVVILFLIIVKKDFIGFIIFLPLLLQLNKEYQNKDNVIHKFYLERYLYHFKFKKRKIIHRVTEMKKDYIHIIRNSNKYITEREFLRIMFDKYR